MKNDDTTAEPHPCRLCANWAEDDDADGRGACIQLLNSPDERGWRTLPDHTCDLWRPF